MEVVEWLSAILVTLVIKISWSLRQTMESMEQLNGNSRREDSRYYTAYLENDIPEEVNENENNTNLERSLDGNGKDSMKSIATSTPRARNGSPVPSIVSPEISYIEDAPKETCISQQQQPTPITTRYERELVDRFCLMRMPTEEDAEMIRTTFARGKISPETEIKYRKFLSSSPTGGRSKASKASQRKNIRL